MNTIIIKIVVLLLCGVAATVLCTENFNEVFMNFHEHFLKVRVKLCEHFAKVHFANISREASLSGRELRASQSFLCTVL